MGGEVTGGSVWTRGPDLSYKITQEEANKPSLTLLQLCMIYTACEKAGLWPCQWDTVLIVLLKKDGGLRPISIFMSPIRIYAKAPFDLAR